MKEIAPGIFHWTSFHKGISQDVHSYYVPASAVVIDPMEPAEGLDWFAEHASPDRVLLTNRHHFRHSARFIDRFGTEVLCHKSGLHEFEGGPDVQGFEFGDQVAPGITAYEVDSLCPEESALHIEAGGGALSVADGVVEWPGEAGLAFVPDFLIGDDPEAVKNGLRAAYRRLADELEFDSLLMAHGNPVTGGGREALRAFVDAS
ncbi:MAG TPA: hypothetical protein VGF74_11170 [Thermoleophilaceae bacterium]